MANDCLPQVNACALRVTRLNALGVPVAGANNMYVSDALTTVAFAWDVTAGQVIEEANGCGAITLAFEAPSTLKRGNITITLLTPDPQLSELLSGGDVLTTGGAVGYAAPPLAALTESPVSIEVWAKRIRGGRVDPTFPYAWWVYPWVSYLRPADHTQDNAALKPAFEGQAFENTGWYNGPLNDWPLPNLSNRVYQWIPTATIPTAVCGYQAVAAS